MKKRISNIKIGACSSTLIRSLKVARWAAKKCCSGSVIQEGISHTLELAKQERSERKAAAKEARRARREQSAPATEQPAPVPA